jgi:sigma-E factor negative regulatory protein RseA
MNEKLSALMDGELDRSEALAVIKSLGQDADQRGDWDSYHLIGDVLRGESVGETTRRRAAAEAIFAKLADEPTILAPAAIAKAAQPVRVEKKARLALAMAASVVTVSAIGVVAYKQQSTAVVLNQAAQQAVIPPVVKQEAKPVDLRVNDYLVVHRQFSNASALQATALKQPETRQAAGQ